MIPLKDDNPAHRPPVITILFIAVCVAVFVWQLSLGSEASQGAVYLFGFIPDRLFGDTAASITPTATIFTSMFMHGGVMHLAGNMLYLWVFGDNIEDTMGHMRFVVFYLLCGVVAAMTQAAIDLDSEIPMIGASGAVSGVLGAYIMRYPGVKVLVLIPVFLVKLPALLVLGLWFGSQLFSSFSAGTSGGVAFAAHVGGFIAGLILMPLFSPRQS